MGRRHRHRRVALRTGVQSREPVTALRPRRHLHPPVRRRAASGRGADPPTMDRSPVGCRTATRCRSSIMRPSGWRPFAATPPSRADGRPPPARPLRRGTGSPAGDRPGRAGAPGGPRPRRATAPRAAGRRGRRATRAASSCSTLTRPGLTLTRTGSPSTSTSLIVAGRGQRSSVVPAHAERAGLGGQHRPRPASAERRVGQGADRVGGPALLHHDRRDPGVVGAGVEQRGDGVGQHLAGGVVDVGLEQHDGLARRRRPVGRRRRAQHDLGDVGPAVELAGAGAEAAWPRCAWRAAAPSRCTVAASRAAPVGVVSSTGTSRP